MTRELDGLQRWYESQCNGDWEHTYGIKIETLDNPGWLVDISVVDTELEERPFAAIQDLEPERSWLFCEVKDGQFRGRGGPAMLSTILRTFLDWAEAPPAENDAAAV